ncbi:AraC family transcriptional regulator [Nocardioides sp. NPDC051685]|uniref:AraC family transcriptional regulator n=1 Tax=Nocardioides sp. NPDC051685 TaxID=3364334 RepID=UPI0037A39BC8
MFTVFGGRQIVETPQQEMVLGPGDVMVMSTRASARIAVPERLRKRSVRIPAIALSSFDTGSGIPECVLLTTAQHPLAGLAHDYLLGMGRQIGRMSPEEVQGARHALLALTDGLIRSSRPDETGFLPLLRRQLETWILEHLAAGPIRVQDLAVAHNVAPRTVHRAFAITGETAGSVVRSYRIAAARFDLVNTSSAVGTIAHRWGFCDTSHLGREFRREFSMSPSDYREAHSVLWAVPSEPTGLSPSQASSGSGYPGAD